MKKITLVLCLLCTLSFAQKPKIAVYVSEQSDYSDDVKNALRSATVNVLVRGGKHEVVERSGVIDEELRRQSSGAIDDDQMVAFGRQAGARYVCVSDIISLGSYPAVTQLSGGVVINQGYSVHTHQVSARIIDVETAQSLGLGVIDQDIQNGQDMIAAITKAVEKMLSTMQEKTNSNLPKKAVYVQGESQSILVTNALYTYTLEALFTRSRYNGDFVVVERSDAFTRQIEREHGKQRSGSVADSEISRMGKQYGIEEICIASIELVMGTYSINARLVNVERANVVNASELRSLKGDLGTVKLNELRNIAVQMVEDMIPRQVTEAEQKEKQLIEAENEKVAQAAWMTGIAIGGGASLNMNDIDPDYFKSLGGQFNMNAEFYKLNLKLLRFGLNFDWGKIGVERDAIRRMLPNVSIDDIKSSNVKLNAFARLYPVNFLFLSGGAGFARYSISSIEIKSNGERADIDVSYIFTPIFSAGGGIFIGSDYGFVIEALSNIVPFKGGRNASYISINAGFKGNIRITDNKKQIREVI